MRDREGAQSWEVDPEGGVAISEGKHRAIGEGAAVKDAVVGGEGGGVLGGALLRPPCAREPVVLLPLPHAVGEAVV